MAISQSEASSIVLAATGRQSLADGLSWISEGRQLASGARIDHLLAAIDSLQDHKGAEAALARLCRIAVDSNIDTSIDLFGVDKLQTAQSYREALNEVAKFTTSGSIADITVEAVAFAIGQNDFVVSALGQVAGLSWRDLRDRVNHRTDVSLPAEFWGPWDSKQVAEVFAVIDAVVRGTEEPGLPGAVAARPVELLYSSSKYDGWEAIADFVEHGVSYEDLLIQRAVGGAWLSHRNSTSGQVAAAVATLVCDSLDGASVPNVRASRLGGKLSPYALNNLIGARPQQVGIVTTTTSGEPLLAISFSVARDGGSARKAASGLARLPGVIPIPCAAIIVGRGWAERGETTELVEAFEGRIYTEKTVDSLTALALELLDEQAHA